MKKVKLSQKAAQKIAKGYPLLQKADLLDENGIDAEDFAWTMLTDPKGNYVGTGYMSYQQKGSGWVVSYDQKEKLDDQFFVKLLRRATAVRADFFHQEETTAFRLFNGEGDGLGGLTVDYYDGYLVLSWYNEWLYHRRSIIYDAIEVVMPKVKGIYEKIRFERGNEAPISQHISGQVAPEPLVIKENGISYATYLDDGLMTGIFLDQREVRGFLAGGIAAGKSVLNTFSYTGAFSVAALMGGARETTSVDLAKRSFEKTKEQFQLNGLDANQQNIVVMDIFEYIKYAQRKKLTFDVIILDPPSFARNKKRRFSAAKDYGKLVSDVLGLLTAGGILLTSTNAAGVSKARFRKMVTESLTESGRSYRRLASYTLPQDFRVLPAFEAGDYLKVDLYEVQ